MKKRLLAAVLCLVMLISCVPSFAFQAQASQLPVITCNGSAQSAVSFPRNERITLTAEGGAWYQWQIKVNDSLWVNISGETGATLDVSYAMIANLCQGDTAYLRVVADGERKSEPVAVTATETVIKEAAAPAAASYVLKAAPRVVVSDPSTDSSTGSSAADSANTEAVAQAQAALTAAEAAANEAAETAAAAKEDAAAKQAAYYEAQNKADAAKAAMEASAVTTEIPAETSAEEFDENGNPVVVEPAEPAETVVTYASDLQAAYAAAQAEADGALQTYQAAEAALADAEANLEDARAAVETAAAALEAAQNQTTGENPGSSNYNLTREATTPSTYNVVINYVFENNEIVADPYTATLAAGSPFSATVTFPTVQGYLPYLNEEQQDDLELNFTAIDQDYTYYVVYKPTNVNYTVIHYQQNLGDDYYVEAERETKQGPTKSTVGDVAKTYEGFYALLYEKPAIAADGSTVVEVYYDRYYYLMNFDLGGGYGVEPIYARYGTRIGTVGTPTKAGYTFDGWDKTIPETMPAENSTYKAIWQADATAKVSVVFWGENANDEEYSYLRSMQVDATPGENYTFDGSTLTCPLAEHSHNSCTLACTHTAHTIDCYSTDYGFIQTDKPDNSLTPKGNGIYTYQSSRRTYYYLNIGDKWYCGTNRWGNADPEEEITYSCVHTHTDECYDCGKIGHTHGSSCSGLWTFAESETVPVAADGSSTVNVYYDRTEKTLTFMYNYNDWWGNYQSTETITAKWGADISVKFKEITAKAGSSFWTVRNDGEGPYTNYIGIMPQTSATYYNRGTTANEGSMTYWGQDLNGQYTIKLFEVTGVGGYSVTDEDRYEFEGFTYHHGSEIGSSAGGATFYYNRKSYTLTFNDGYNDVKSESVLYEAPLSTYNSYVPPVPSGYEPDSVQFGGWYLNPECSGAEYKLNEHTMPADNVLLYAKWVPVIHTVSFYLDADALDDGTELETHPAITVPHGSLAPTVEKPTNGGYTFVGWFYLENGVEKAFDFKNMPVTKDLEVYAKWSSNDLKEYTVYYKIQGTDTQIADPTTGSGLAGITKTFDAKGGTDLYADYQEGYFPVTKSHSMTIDINATEENDTNVFTFWYVQKNAVPYTVKYLNKETGEPVADEKTVSDNRKAVVTETFVPVSGMMPDAYQKRLVVSAEENAVNEIIFYYTEDTTHAYYKITHYTENLGTDAQGTTWTEYASSQAVGDIGTTYTADPMTIPGFTYDENVTGTVKSGKLTAEGLELKLYYTRNSYPYQVRYLEQGTGKTLATPKDGNGKYGQVISESAIEIANYTAVDPKAQTLNIRIETPNDEGETVATLNVITFYYTEKEATINYVVVGPEDCGTVTPTSETLKVLTGTAQGSTAAASSNSYKFVGWYSDRSCTEEKKLSTDAKYTPTKADGTAWVDETTYYAKFEYDLTTLTIKKTGALNGDDGFIFDVKENDVIRFTVSVKGNGSVTIAGVKVGTTYTITERGNWAWRYDVPTSITIKLVANGNKVEFVNGSGKQYLLDGSAYARNNSVLSNTAE